MKAIVFIISLIFNLTHAIGQNYNHPTLLIDTIYSTFLKENRALTIYLPPNFSTNKTYKVIYTTDGQMLTKELYINTVDSLINNKLLPELIIIGVHSNNKKVPNSDLKFRNCEYVKGLTNDSLTESRFTNHLDFFVKEVIPYAENKYFASQNSKDRIFYGCSNGGGFGATLGSTYPFLISNYICNSLAGADLSNLAWTSTDYPYFYINYGSSDNSLIVNESKKLSHFLESKGFCFSFKQFNGGHEKNAWRIEFFEDLKKVLK